MTRDKKAGGAGSPGSKRQKKTRVVDGDQVPAAPDGLSERMQQRHRYVTCGADVNVHVNLFALPPPPLFQKSPYELEKASGKFEVAERASAAFSLSAMHPTGAAALRTEMAPLSACST